MAHKRGCLLFLMSIIGLLLIADTASVHGQQDDDNALVAVDTEEEDTPQVQYRGKAFSKEDFDPSIEEFKPSHEWQPVKKAQAVPPGLHIRLNMETGEREAKLLDGDDGARFHHTSNGNDVLQTDESQPSKLSLMKEALEDAMKELKEFQGSSDVTEEDTRYWKHGDMEGMFAPNKERFTRQELKEALKKFKVTKLQEEEEADSDSSSQYRTAEELKEVFEEMNLEMKTDLEILQELMTRYQTADIATQTRLNILTDFEYYVHQIDNAQNLVDMGGLELIVKDLNHTEETIRSEAAFVIGSAVQSNPKVQVAAIQAGTMQQLIRLLSVEANIPVRNRALYAMSTLTRNFPLAQQKLLDFGGLQALSALFQQPGTDKLRIRAVTLVTDLLFERRTAEEQGEMGDKRQKEKLLQYQQVPLLAEVMDLGWCDVIPSLLSLPEHDAREKVLGAMSLLSLSCGDKFAHAQSSLQRLKLEYEQLSEERRQNSGDLYFSELLGTVDTIIDQLRRSSRKDL